MRMKKKINGLNNGIKNKDKEMLIINYEQDNQLKQMLIDTKYPGKEVNKLLKDKSINKIYIQKNGKF